MFKTCHTARVIGQTRIVQKLGGMSEVSSAIYLCRVCGDRASGVHYGVLCCEGCKGFFFRTIRGNKRYAPCMSPSNCLILPLNRSGCKFCRMQRCLQLGMSYEAVKMGRRPKNEQRRLKPSLVTKTVHQDDIILDIYSAFTIACKTVFTDSHEISDVESCMSNEVAFVQKGIKFATALAKQLTFFKSFPCDIQHNLIKTSVIEMCIVSEAIRIETRNSPDVVEILAIDGDTVIRDICTNGHAIVNKVLALDLTQSEYSLIVTLILFCSDRHSTGIDHSEKLQLIQESILSALKYQLILNHNHPLGILPHIIEIICCLRGVTTLFLDDLLGLVAV